MGGPLPACVGVPTFTAPAQVLPNAPTQQHSKTWATMVAARPDAPCSDYSAECDGRTVDSDAMAPSARPQREGACHSSSQARSSVERARFDWIWGYQALPTECLEPSCSATRISRPPCRMVFTMDGLFGLFWSGRVCVIKHFKRGLSMHSPLEVKVKPQNTRVVERHPF